VPSPSSQLGTPPTTGYATSKSPITTNSTALSPNLMSREDNI
ncbi:hypothetical protein A2U01_0089390, partial [Trifolium medium]|nr:hypothetical protein [Trifolium medium]